MTVNGISIDATSFSFLSGIEFEENCQNPILPSHKHFLYTLVCTLVYLWSFLWLKVQFYYLCGKSNLGQTKSIFIDVLLLINN